MRLVDDVRGFLVYLACRVFLWLLRSLPRIVALGLVDSIATAAYWLARRHRLIARTNLRIAFPDLGSRERNRIARRSFCGAARNLVELSRIPSQTLQSIRSLVEYDPDVGLDNYRAARHRGKCILYLTGHFSSWELLPAAHALYGHPLSFVTRPLDNTRLETHLCKLREACGNTVIGKKNSARRVLESLRHGRDVGLLIDQNSVLAEGIYSELFGLPAATTSSLALLALRTDATVLAGYLTPMRTGKYRIRFLPPLDLIRTGNREADVVENTRLFNRVVERIVREQPDSWLWAHKRWKYQPGRVDVYAMTESELDRYVEAMRRQVPAGIEP